VLLPEGADKEKTPNRSFGKFNFMDLLISICKKGLR